MSQEEKVKLSLYRHFRGEFYRVTGMATHANTDEKLVIYQSASTPGALWAGKLWVRPVEEFTAYVNPLDGQETVERFKLITPHLTHSEHVNAYRRFGELSNVQNFERLQEIWSSYYPTTDGTVEHPEEPLDLIIRNACSMLAPIDEAFIVNWLVLYGDEKPIPRFEERAPYVEQMLADLREKFPSDYS